MTSEKNRRILVVDDDHAIHEDFRKILTCRNESGHLQEMQAKLFGKSAEQVPTESYELDSAYQGKEGYELVCRSVEQGEPYALAFVDMRMPPGWDGLETIEKIWSVDSALQVVICSAYSDHPWEDILKRFGSGDRLLVLKKPFDTVEVCQLACALTEKWHLARHARLKLDQLSSMVHEQTRELAEARQQLEQEVVVRREAQAELRQSEHRYTLAAAATNDGLWDWDLKSNTIFYSPRWKEMLGYSDSEIGNSPEDWFGRIDPQHVDWVKSEVSAHLRREREHLCVEYRIMHKDGHYRWMLVRGLGDRVTQDNPVHIVGLQADITDRKLAEEQLRHEALHDPLTGLGNRTLLLERVGGALERAREDHTFRFGVLFLDLDNFKVVNDSLGHAIGDLLLQSIAKRLTVAVRTRDTAARLERDCLARLGGDEFVILLECLDSHQDALAVAERLQQAIAAPFNFDGKRIFASTSIGIALNHEEYANPEELLRDADTALYQAKGSTNGHCVIFNREMHTLAMARWEMESELRRAIEQNQLKLQFQPIVSLSTGRVVEFEALVRWMHPERGMILPSEFISVAEETGLIIPLGSWVLREACSRWCAWRSQGLEDFSIGVNVSEKQFAQVGLVDEISALLKHHQMDPRCLKLEITESALMENAGATMKNLNRLSELNIQLHLDDFGTGYSSLSYLHRMPVAALKIDRSFVSNMIADRTSRSIVEAIIALAQALEVDAIAEGVETEQQLHQLTEMGCDLAQGYYFSRPVDHEQVKELLSREYATEMVAG